MGIMERKLVDLGIDLPNPPKPSGVYVPATTVGNLYTLLVQGVK